MKKFIILLFMFVPFLLAAQTTISEDVVLTKYGAVGDTLNKDDVVTDSWYIDDFSTDSEVFWDIDSVAGRTKVKLDFEGSYDNSNWITINSTTLTVATGDTTFVQSSGTYLYPYLKSYATAIDSVQTTKYKRVIVIKKN